ncbi:MAG TPA: class I SAM-dependent methyltransferase [Leptospiraceae bacterium]|nr:class I SAM-dependent methyltransferase [Leptospiraceae bacterium]
MKLYEELAEYYYEIEKHSRNFRHEIDFLNEVFQAYGVNSVLDLGCGTGEHLAELQKMGFQITGIDSSREMVKVSKKRFPGINVREGRIQKFHSEIQHDAVICLYGTFNYLIENIDLQNSFQSIRNALKSGGVLFLDIWNAVPLQKIKRKPIAPVSLSKVGETLIRRNRGFFLRSSSEDSVSDQTLIELNFVFDMNKKLINDRHIMRVFNLNEIRDHLENAGFRFILAYGNYSKEPFQATSGRILVLAMKL